MSDADSAARSEVQQAPQAQQASQEMPSELGIKGLQPGRPRAGNLKSQVAGIGLIVSVIAVAGMIVWTRFGPQDQPSQPKIAVASDQLPPLRFEAQREPSSATPAAASAPSGAAADPQNQTNYPTGPAQPIALRNPGPGPAATPVVPSLAGSVPPGGAATANASTNAYPSGAVGYAPPQRRDDSPFVTSPANGWPQVSSAGSPGSNLQRTSHIAQNTGNPLATASANLEQYQTQLDGMVRQLQTLTDQAQGASAGTPGTAGPAFGQPAQASAQAAAPAAAQPRNPALFEPPRILRRLLRLRMEPRCGSPRSFPPR